MRGHFVTALHHHAPRGASGPKNPSREERVKRALVIRGPMADGGYYGRNHLSGRTDRYHYGHTFIFWPTMTMIETSVTEPRVIDRRVHPWRLEWSPIVLGALTATAVSSILLTFGVSVGLGVSSASPTWRDASLALWLLSGIFIILQALVSFGCGGYLAGRTRPSYADVGADDVERFDGWHGIASWALAVLLSAIIAALIAMAASRPTALTAPTSTSEPSVLSYEIDHLFRAERRLPSNELEPVRAEAGRILLTSSSHGGVSADDRAFLVQLVGTVTGLGGPDAERRVDTSIADAKRAIARTRASTIMVSFSVATSLLLGAIAAWAGAEAGGRHRDGMPLPQWMRHTGRFNRRREAWQRPTPVP